MNIGNLSDQYMTTGEAARLTGRHDETFRRAIDSGELPAVKRFGYHVLKKGDVLQFHKNHRGRKLSRGDVAEIKRMLFQGALQKDIAQMYGVSNGLISDIKNERTWTGVRMAGLEDSE